MSKKVYLVGAGPGDPGLITVKGKECIEKADVIIYDYLASPTLLRYANSKAEMIYVGKKGGEHTLSQEGINDLIVQKAKTGATVTRLKGGDPFIFGRGGEEAEVLIKAGIGFEIVPGITSAIAAPAYAGIPLTHRKFTSTVAFITGHEDPSKDNSSINWASLAHGIGTLVFLMGVKNLPNIVKELVNNGKSPETPAALVRWGTTSRQKTVSGTLSDIVERVRENKMKAPAIIVVGDVVRLREQMKWFESRPLLGKKIVVTRAREQASDLVENLLEMGADVLECPTIKVVPAQDLSLLDLAISRLKSYEWIVFTSVNGVKHFFERLYATGLDARALGHLCTAAIGPATSDMLFKFGLKTDIIPESYRAESVVEAFSKQNIAGKNILLPRAGEARPILPVELKKMGANIDEIITYRTVQDRQNVDILLENLQNSHIDMVTFTSSSTVKNFKALIADDMISPLMNGVTVACIGPITADTAKELGFNVHVVADKYTIPGLCEAIVRHYKQKISMA
ncbi:MAG: uroporphyrinogen-III C-methyltransferase [Desulfobacterales bacterium]